MLPNGSRFSLLSRDSYFSLCGSRAVLPNGSRFSLLAPFQRCRATTAPARRLSALRREDETLSHCLALLGSIWSVALAPVLQCCGKPSPTSIRRMNLPRTNSKNSPRHTVSYWFPGFPGGPPGAPWAPWGPFSEGSESYSEYSECSSE